MISQIHEIFLVIGFSLLTLTPLLRTNAILNYYLTEKGLNSSAMEINCTISVSSTSPSYIFIPPKAKCLIQTKLTVELNDPRNVSSLHVYGLNFDEYTPLTVIPLSSSSGKFEKISDTWGEGNGVDDLFKETESGRHSNTGYIVLTNKTGYSEMYVFNNNTRDVNAVLTVTDYKIEDEVGKNDTSELYIPGVCSNSNQTFDASGHVLNMTWNSNIISVKFKPIGLVRIKFVNSSIELMCDNIDPLSRTEVSYEVYVLYASSSMPSATATQGDILLYMIANLMGNVTSIQSNGLKISPKFVHISSSFNPIDDDSMVVDFAAYPGSGLVVGVLAHISTPDMKNMTRAYVSSSTYACEKRRGSGGAAADEDSEDSRGDCLLFKDTLSKLICASLVLIGLYFTFNIPSVRDDESTSTDGSASNNPLKAVTNHSLMEIFFMSSLITSILTFIALSSHSILSIDSSFSNPYLTLQILLIGSSGGLIVTLLSYCMDWCESIVSQSISIFISSMVMTCVLHHTVLSRSLNSWITIALIQQYLFYMISSLICLTFMVILTLLLPRYLQTLLTSSIIGVGGCLLVPISFYTGSTLQFSVYNLLRRITIPQFHWAVTYFPLQSTDEILLAILSTIAVISPIFKIIGIVVHHKKATSRLHDTTLSTETSRLLSTDGDRQRGRREDLEREAIESVRHAVRLMAQLGLDTNVTASSSTPSSSVRNVTANGRVIDGQHEPTVSSPSAPPPYTLRDATTSPFSPSLHQMASNSPHNQDDMNRVTMERRRDIFKPPSPDN